MTENKKIMLLNPATNEPFDAESRFEKTYTHNITAYGKADTADIEVVIFKANAKPLGIHASSMHDTFGYYAQLELLPSTQTSRQDIMRTVNDRFYISRNSNEDITPAERRVHNEMEHEIVNAVLQAVKDSKHLL